MGISHNKDINIKILHIKSVDKYVKSLVYLLKRKVLLIIKLKDKGVRVWN